MHHRDISKARNRPAVIPSIVALAIYFKAQSEQLYFSYSGMGGEGSTLHGFVSWQPFRFHISIVHVCKQQKLHQVAIG